MADTKAETDALRKRVDDEFSQQCAFQLTDGEKTYEICFDGRLTGFPAEWRVFNNSIDHLVVWLVSQRRKSEAAAR